MYVIATTTTPHKFLAWGGKWVDDPKLATSYMSIDRAYIISEILKVPTTVMALDFAAKLYNE